MRIRRTVRSGPVFLLRTRDISQLLRAGESRSKSDAPLQVPLQFVRHDAGAGGGEHTAHTMADQDLAPGIWAGAVPRIWRMLSYNAYMPECM